MLLVERRDNMQATVINFADGISQEVIDAVRRILQGVACNLFFVDGDRRRAWVVLRNTWKTSLSRSQKEALIRVAKGAIKITEEPVVRTLVLDTERPTHIIR